MIGSSTGAWSRWSMRAGLVVLAVAIALALTLLTEKGIGFDLGSYVLAARRFLAGSSMYPDPATYAPGPFDQYVYPPPVILVFVPLAVIPFDAARLIWFLLLCGVAILLLARLVRPLPPSARWWAAAAYVLFFPLLWDIQLGNVTLITLYLCVLAWDLRERWPLSGALAAAGIGVKLLPANLLVFFALASRWRILAALGVVGVAILVLTWPLVGHEWPTYLLIFQKRLAGAAAGEWNIIPSRFASGIPRLALLSIPLLAAVFGGLCARRAAADVGFRLAIAAAPLASTTAWYPYTLLSLPLLLAVPPAGAWRVPSLVLRPVAWLLMMVQAAPEPERYTTLPFAGLVLLLGVGTVDALILLRSSRLPANGVRVSPTG
jgi:hypothetical protein